MSGDTADSAAPVKTAGREDAGWFGFLRLMVIVLLGVLAFRTFIFAPFTIPSESMLPRLMKGDFLIAAKWPYGYSKLSVPGEYPIIPGRIFADLPKRGDIAIFKHPVDGSDYVKRVIGLPGDTVALRKGRLTLNGVPAEHTKIDDFRLRASVNTACAWAATEEIDALGTTCRYRRYRERLPSGRSYETLDFGNMRQDNWGPFTVPEGEMFVMGDNRDNSQDSRFPATTGGGVGFVPIELLVGRAQMILWSTDGSAEWLKPWTWFTAARWERIGDPL